MKLTLSVRSFQVPETPLHLRLAPQLAVGAHLARHPRHLRGERVELVHHRVDDLAVRKNSPRSGRPSISSTMVCDRSPFATASITRATSDGRPDQVADQVVHRIDAVHPRTARGGHPCSLVDFPFLADLIADTGELSCIVSFIWTMSLNASAISPSIPVRSGGMRTEKSPRLNARNARRYLPVIEYFPLSRNLKICHDLLPLRNLLPPETLPNRSERLFIFFKTSAAGNGRRQ